MFNDVHYSIIIATMVIFIFMIFILNSIFYKPLLKFIDERNNSIKNDENKIKENSHDVSEIDFEIKKIRNNTKEEIFKIKNETILAAKEEKNKLIKNKKDKLEQELNLFYEDLNKQKVEFENQLMSYLPDLKNSVKNKFKNI